MALAEPTMGPGATPEARVARPVVPRLCDEGTLDELLTRVYAADDADKVMRTLPTSVVVPSFPLVHPSLTAKPATAAMLGYATVARSPSGPIGVEFREQAHAIAEECRRRGLVLLQVVRELETGRSRAVERPGLSYALDRISAGEASGLVVSDLSRLSPTVSQLGEVLEWLLGRKIRVVVAAQGLDTAERVSRRAARTLIEVSGWERDRLGERARNGLKAARAKGRVTVADNPQIRDGIARMRAEGMTLQAIADHLNATSVPTVRGGVEWRPSSVQAAAGYRRPPGRQSGAPHAWKGPGGGAAGKREQG